VTTNQKLVAITSAQCYAGAMFRGRALGLLGCLALMWGAVSCGQTKRVGTEVGGAESVAGESSYGGEPGSGGNEFSLGGESNSGGRVSTGGARSDGTEGMGGSMTDECFLERLGYGTQCVDALGIEEFRSVAECAAACLDDPECAGIGDYSVFVGLDIGCTTLKTCHPKKTIWTEEDGRFDYRKVCGKESTHAAVEEFPPIGVDVTSRDDCFYVSPGASSEEYVCEGAVTAKEMVGEDIAGATLEECLAACDDRADCSAVQDWWLGEPTKFECVLHLGTCDAPRPSDNDDHGRFFRKTCGQEKLCEPGSFRSEDGECQLCSYGTFQPEVEGSECQPWAPLECGADEFATGTPVSDSQCESRYFETCWDQLNTTSKHAFVDGSGYVYYFASGDSAITKLGPSGRRISMLATVGSVSAMRLKSDAIVVTGIASDGAYVQKLDLDGRNTWTTILPIEAGERDWSWDLEVDHDGAVYVAPRNGDSSRVVKLNSVGHLIWNLEFPHFRDLAIAPDSVVLARGTLHRVSKDDGQELSTMTALGAHAVVTIGDQIVIAEEQILAGYDDSVETTRLVSYAHDGTVNWTLTEPQFYARHSTNWLATDGETIAWSAEWQEDDYFQVDTIYLVSSAGQKLRKDVYENGTGVVSADPRGMFTGPYFFSNSDVVNVTAYRREEWSEYSFDWLDTVCIQRRRQQDMPAVELVADKNCFWERIPYGSYCARSQVFEVSMSAPEDCVSLCLANPECGGIQDLTDRGHGCRLIDECEVLEPNSQSFGDPPFFYKKVCGEEPSERAVTEFPPAGIDVTEGDGCSYRWPSSPINTVCEGALVASEVMSGTDVVAATLEECLAKCDSRPDCTAVQQWWQNPQSEFSCVLHLGTCDAPVPSSSSRSNGTFYKKFCAAN
jgi:PAN domain